MLKVVVISILSLASLHLSAANITQIGRYASVRNQAKLSQIDPLKTVQQMHFPLWVQTIGEALDYWLRYTGYHLTEKDKQIHSLKMILQQPLPQADRTLGPLTVHDGLSVLVGKNQFILVQDDLKREVNFVLNNGKSK